MVLTITVLMSRLPRCCVGPAPNYMGEVQAVSSNMRTKIHPLLTNVSSEDSITGDRDRVGLREISPCCPRTEGCGLLPLREGCGARNEMGVLVVCCAATVVVADEMQHPIRCVE